MSVHIRGRHKAECLVAEAHREKRKICHVVYLNYDTTNNLIRERKC